MVESEKVNLCDLTQKGITHLPKGLSDGNFDSCRITEKFLLDMHET